MWFSFCSLSKKHINSSNFNFVRHKTNKSMHEIKINKFKNSSLKILLFRTSNHTKLLPKYMFNFAPPCYFYLNRHHVKNYIKSDEFKIYKLLFLGFVVSNSRIYHLYNYTFGAPNVVWYTFFQINFESYKFYNCNFCVFIYRFSTFLILTYIARFLKVK